MSNLSIFRKATDNEYMPEDEPTPEAYFWRLTTSGGQFTWENRVGGWNKNVATTKDIIDIKELVLATSFDHANGLEDDAPTAITGKAALEHAKKTLMGLHKA